MQIKNNNQSIHVHLCFNGALAIVIVSSDCKLNIAQGTRFTSRAYSIHKSLGLKFYELLSTINRARSRSMP